MSDENPDPTGTPNTDPADKSKESDDGDDDEFKGLSEEWQKKFKGLRSEIAAKRQDVKTAREESKVAKEEAAQLRKAKEDEELEKKKKNGEWEKVAEEKDKALLKANDRTMRAELRLAAQREGILDPSDVNSVPLEGLTLDDNGEVHGAEKLIKKLKADKPHWFKSADPPAQKSDPPKSTSKGADPPPGTPAPKDLSKMTAAELDAWEKDYLREVRSARR